MDRQLADERLLVDCSLPTASAYRCFVDPWVTRAGRPDLSRSAATAFPTSDGIDDREFRRPTPNEGGMATAVPGS